jgi:hypothetical protein
VTFDTRPDVPVHQHLLYPTAKAARATRRGTLAIACCPACGFVFNRAFDPNKIEYGENYNNSQLFSAAFNAHVDTRIDALTACAGSSARIVEIGCGDGAFLTRLVGSCPPGVSGVGYDPAYTGPHIALDGRVRFERQYYGPDCADTKADIVVSRHVIEHVPDPVPMLQMVVCALSGSQRPRVFFETPCVEWILENEVIWDFFYEHCSYFSSRSIRTAFERAGFDVTSVTHVFGGQYLWLEAEASDHPTVAEPSAGEVPRLATAFQSGLDALRRHWDDLLARYATAGTVALWGAGAKGVTFANLIDSDCRLVRAVIDQNGAKQGGYLPGTGHPIVGPSEIRRLGITHALSLNPNYLFEMRRTLDAISPEVQLVDLMDVQRAGTS